MNKRAKASNFMLLTFGLLALVIIFLFLSAFGLIGPEWFSKDVKSLFPEVTGDTFYERIKSDTPIGVALGNSDMNWLRYIFGNVPDYLVVLTGGTPDGEAFSAGIVIIGIWILLLLSFADIVKLFSTFNTPTSWIAAIVLTIVAANVKVVMVITVFMLTVTAGFGTFAVFAGIILAFALFLGVQFGSDTLREFAVKRKMSEMRMRAAMGSERAAAGLEAAAKFEKAAEKAR